MSNYCEKEGEFAATITDAKVIQHRFQAQHPGALEIRIDLEDEDGATGKTYLDLSDEYVTAGARKGERQCDVTAETMLALGVDIPGGRLADLVGLKGRAVSIFGKRNAKGYLNFYLNTTPPEKAMKPDDAAAKLEALFGGGKKKAAAKPKPQAGPGELLPPIYGSDADDDGPSPF